MKTLNKILVSSLACFALTACGDGAFDVDNAGVVGGDRIEEMAQGDPEALKELVEPLSLGLLNYLSEYNAGGQARPGFSAHFDFGFMGQLHLANVMSDDLAFTTQGNGHFTFDHQFDYWGANYVKGYVTWKVFYTIIQRANEIIGMIPATAEDADLKGLRGQALALRGLAHAYLAQYFQQTYIGNEDALGVPIYLTNGEEGTVLNRATLRQVYTQVEKDFKKSFEFLEGWQRPNKTYIDLQVAKGLYSRICLVTNNWDDAIKYANEARKGYSIYTPAQVTDPSGAAFNNITSPEVMWGSDITPETSTAFASFFSFICAFEEGYGGAIGNYQQIDRRLFDAMGENDCRKKLYINPGEKLVVNYSSEGAKPTQLPTYTNKKFRKVNNWLADYIFLRASELILTEAEAYAHKGDNPTAAKVLKELMAQRDPSWNLTMASVDDVYMQRRIELWGEGFSLFDHQRLHKGIDRTYAGSNHFDGAKYKIPAGSGYFIFQIPNAELDNNSYITEAEQNPTPTGPKVPEQQE